MQCFIDVNLDFEGGTTATIRYIVNGGTPVNIPGLNAPYSTTIGPFNPGDQVQVLLVNDDDAACTRNLGTTNIVAPAGQPTVTASANPTTICAGGSTTLSAVASGGNGPVPTCVFQTATGGTLADMSGATVLLGAGFDDSVSGSTAMGFSFNYGAAPYTTFFASSNGQLTLGAAGNASLGNSLATSTPRPLITPWWDDCTLDAMAACRPSSSEALAATSVWWSGRCATIRAPAWPLPCSCKHGSTRAGAALAWMHFAIHRLDLSKFPTLGKEHDLPAITAAWAAERRAASRRKS